MAEDHLSDLSGAMALHIYHVLLTAMKELLQPGMWFEEVFHHCCRIEFQSRGTVHIHIALWAIAAVGMHLEGRTGHSASEFVNHLSNLFGGCKVMRMHSTDCPYPHDRFDEETIHVLVTSI